MDRYEKIKKIENLQKIHKGLEKLLQENENELKLINISETPFLICTNIDENDVNYIYYLADLDRVEKRVNELLPNTIDLQGRLGCSFNLVSIQEAREYLNKLIKEIITTQNVNSWTEISNLLEKKLSETGTINHKK